MSLSKPRLASVEFGVKRFLLNPDHFNEPCKLFDLMTQDVEICAAGVFVGELSHLPEHTLEAQIRQVNLIKSVIKNDRDRTGEERQFMPIIQERACLWADFGSLRIVPQVPKGREYCQKRRQFIDLLVTTDICEPKEKSKL
ncbi:uncharacterized protein LOC127751529 [Frankliniella occidentalis]|uniref:Uncharacterized protein LOC127751529 n=1 Tax=Frankliniella occidentalis TaxID=133901 RepID=A0A9C6X8E2_FRAOC|nr:uncharacterized protein LOC127751529 [Frankliniella occidentalis]